MVQVLYVLLLTVFQAESTLEQGSQLKREGKYFAAESLYLAEEPKDDEIAHIGLALADISLRMGNTPGRRAFYQGYLSKSKRWRGVSALVLASLTLASHEFESFGNYARIFFDEYPMVHPVRYRLLYQLARYTNQNSEELSLTQAEGAWFKACRATHESAGFPTDPHPDLPTAYRYAYLLATPTLKTLPQVGDKHSGEDQYIHLLIQLRHALLQADPFSAAQLINRITPLDKQMDRNDLRLHYYPLLAEFFVLRGFPEQASIVSNNLEKVRKSATLPLVLLPQYLTNQDIPHKDTPAKTTETSASTPREHPKKVEPDQPKRTSSASRDPFEYLERRLLAGQRGLELQIRRLEADTHFRKIYRNYLLGTHYLLGGRLKEAHDRLAVAEKQITELPFPNLEAKILLAMGDYHEKKSQPEKAEWYRLQALQIWIAPDNIPILALDENALQPSPIRVLLDKALERNDELTIHQLLYYSELQRFVSLIRRAYRRQTLNVNPVLSEQMQLIGNRLGQQVRALANNPDHEANPRRFNQTLAIWQQLWSQTSDYYRTTATPTVKKLQAALLTGQRLISFVEGDHQLGVLFISKTQAFALPLGGKQFLTLQSGERIGFLAARIGPIWETNGTLTLSLAQGYRQTDLLNALRRKMPPGKLKLVFSLKSFAARKQRGNCRGKVFFSEELIENKGFDESYELKNLSRANLETALEESDELHYAGPLIPGLSGLPFGKPEVGFFFHEIVHFNPNLCSLTLLAQEVEMNWSLLLDELELINPSTALSINFLDKGSQLGEGHKRGGIGIQFPEMKRTGN